MDSKLKLLDYLLRSTMYYSNSILYTGISPEPPNSPPMYHLFNYITSSSDVGYMNNLTQNLPISLHLRIPSDHFTERDRGLLKLFFPCRLTDARMKVFYFKRITACRSSRIFSTRETRRFQAPRDDSIRESVRSQHVLLQFVRIGFSFAYKLRQFDHPMARTRH